MTREQAVASCRDLWDKGITSIGFRRHGEDWVRHGERIVVHKDGFTILFGMELLTEVDGKTNDEKYSSFEKALEAADQFMGDFEE